MRGSWRYDGLTRIGGAAMQSERPVQKEFRSRVVAALAALEGYPGAPRSFGQLAEDAGLTPPNLASALALRRTMTWNALRRLHRALRLDALGVDIEVWDMAAEDPAILSREIAARRVGDPVELARKHAEKPFLGVAASGAFMGVRPVRQGEPDRMVGVAAYPGQNLEVTVSPPVDGFVKVVCREGAEFFSLDEHLGLTHRRFRAGQPVVLDRRIRVEGGYYGETVFIALASGAAFDPLWPRGASHTDTVSRETCANLLNALFERQGTACHVSLFSVWTLPETLTRSGAPA
jgi:hypothetical protein